MLIGGERLSGNALKAYTEKYEDQDQMLFQQLLNLEENKSLEQVYNLSEIYLCNYIQNSPR